MAMYYDNIVHGGHHEVRCMKSKVLLEALEAIQKELLIGTIKFSSKVVTIEDWGCFKLVHIANSSNWKTKALIGCDGMNLNSKKK